MLIEQGLTWSTFEDFMPHYSKDRWEKLDDEGLHRCFKHDTLFDRTKEPCWQCYNDYYE